MKQSTTKQPTRNNPNKVYKQKDLFDDGKELLIHEQFYSVQTEGIFAGRPASFIRLHGCNLNCSWCDTPQDEAKATLLTPKKILKRLEKEKPHSRLVIITGGEPLLHNLVRLVTLLLDNGYWIQFETNGTVSNKDMPWDHPNLYPVVSPKTKKIHNDLKKHAFSFKYVVKKGMQDKDGLPKGLWRPDLTDQEQAKKIIISPMFENWSVETEENMAEALKICTHFGYYFSVQYHKIIKGIK